MPHIKIQHTKIPVRQCFIVIKSTSIVIIIVAANSSFLYFTHDILRVIIWTNKILGENSTRVHLLHSAMISSVMLTVPLSCLIFYVRIGEPEYVDKFTYLGSIIVKDGDTETDVIMRLAKETEVFRRMDSVWKSSFLSLKSNCNCTLRSQCQWLFMQAKCEKVQHVFNISWTYFIKEIYVRSKESHGETRWQIHKYWLEQIKI